MKRRKGQGLVEFALILPVLLFILLGIIEAAFVIQGYLTVQHAAERQPASRSPTSRSRARNLTAAIVPVRRLRVLPSPIQRRSAISTRITLSIMHDVLH